MRPPVFDEQKTANASLADKEAMPCSAFAKEQRSENKANRSFGKTKGATPPRQRAYVHFIIREQANRTLKFQPSTFVHLFSVKNVGFSILIFNNIGKNDGAGIYDKVCGKTCHLLKKI